MGFFHQVQAAWQHAAGQVEKTYSHARDELDKSLKNLNKSLRLPFPVPTVDQLEELGFDIADLALALEILMSPLGKIILPVILAYYAFLETQARGRLKPIPKPLRDYLQPYYHNDLGQVHYAEHIETLTPGTAVTIDQHIFFPAMGRPMDFYGDFAGQTCYDTGIAIGKGWCDLKWLCHELQHTTQCHEMGGAVPEALVVIGEIPQAFIEALAKGRVTFYDIAGSQMNVHNLMRIEVEARRKAKRLITESDDITNKIIEWKASTATS